MSAKPAHFTPGASGQFEPARFAGSHWGDDHLNGPAVVGLAAYALEKQCGSTDFMPSRLTVDLFRAARYMSTAVSVRVVRDGRRVRSAECDVAQEDWLVARATLLQYRRSTAPPGRLWTTPMSFPFPPPFEEVVQTAVHSDAAQWSHSPGEHQNDSRKRFYNNAIDVVAGQPNSQFLRAVTVAEATSLVGRLHQRRSDGGIGATARRGVDRCAGRFALGSRRSGGRDGDALRPLRRLRIRHDDRGRQSWRPTRLRHRSIPTEDSFERRAYSQEVAMAGQRTVFNHVGLCVADTARSRRFYEGLLDFTFWWELAPPDEGTGQLLQLNTPIGLRATYLVRDGLVLELLAYSHRLLRAGTERVMDQVGLTHLSLSVSDLGTVLAQVEDFGGSIVVESVSDQSAMIRDPDGQLLELLSDSWLSILPPRPN
jgi:catechol 2,3-dioxygenase-like lactoylglutathione lyase family enzyme